MKGAGEIGFMMIAMAVAACGTPGKIAGIAEQGLSASISLPGESASEALLGGNSYERPDTIWFRDVYGKDMIVMKAVRDDETGEMVATEELKAAVVTARFRNVAERHGCVSLEFCIIVPEALRDGAWQLRFHPRMYIQDETVRLDDVHITGEGYRAAQLKGYQQYERFISRIISDSTLFVDIRNLDMFIKRNLPGIYAFKTDSTEVSDEQFQSRFGVSEKEAVSHYTDHFAIRRNDQRKAKRQKMWGRYIKAPIVTEHLRLDTVIHESGGDVIYNYIQDVRTGDRPGLNKVSIVLGGEIYEQGTKIYNIPDTEPLTFYISSLSTFVDESERYLTKVVERNVGANSTWRIDFRTGKADIDPSLGENAASIREIKEKLTSLICNEAFDLDSIMISASASPEGSLRSNSILSAKRASNAAGYFSGWVTHVRDSLRKEAGLSIILGPDSMESMMESAYSGSDIRFLSGSAGENWSLLDNIVEADSTMTTEQKLDYFGLASEENLDKREMRMASRPYYRHLRETAYPRLRTVRFDFFLHRKGMIKDTVVTHEPDTAYRKAVQLLKEKKYDDALEILLPYEDFNTAIAYVSLDRNRSAMSILERLPRTAAVNYMMAVIHSRWGEERDAVECYIRSCQQDRSFIHRGNLDPEISTLIRLYGLNQ